MYAELGVRVVAADLDPQANLTAAFIDEDRLEQLWPDGEHPDTIFGCIQPILKGTGDIAQPHIEMIVETLGLIVGDLALSGFEDELSAQWPACVDGKERAFRVISAFWRILDYAAQAHDSELLLVDVGPNLGAINRAALIAADHFVVPLSPDLFSLQGLRNLGPTLRRWRNEWQERVKKNPDPVHLTIPAGTMEPTGYVILQHAVRLDRPVRAYERWIGRIPKDFRQAVLNQSGDDIPSAHADPYRLALLKHYRSLMPLAQEAHKPVFLLKPADGAIGAHLQAVHTAYSDFEELARKIAERTKVHMPSQPVGD
jgi:cellulose biosynthesis protein BcsQ